jgi:acyl-CoA synthetase (AMP-forming)/AMP-acid ligase II
MKMTPTGALMRQAQTRPKNVAFVFHEELWTYERLAAEAERLARGLAAHGVEPGDRVALHMMNRPEMVVAYYACFKLGAIAAPLRTAFKFAELAPLLQRLKPALYIAERGLCNNVAPVDASILAPHKRFIVSETVEGHDVQPWEALFDEAADKNLSVSLAQCEPAVLINTSGTTGQPKFVVHTPETLSESVELIIKHQGFSDADVMIMIMPLLMAHRSGLISFLCYIQFGAPFVLLAGFDADTVLDAIERHRCTWCFGFPAQYAALLECQRARPRDLASLRICFTGADVCPIDLQERTPTILGAPLYNMWGATEVMGSLTFGLQHGPVVRTLKGARIRLIDENGADVADGEAGEPLVRGANVFDGYWNDPEATAESLKGGWYHRRSDAARRGRRPLVHIPQERHHHSRRHQYLACRNGAGAGRRPSRGRAGRRGGHTGCRDGSTCVWFRQTRRRSKDTVVSEILRNVATRLASYKVPQGLRVVDELPRNALSKVDRNMLQAMASRAAKAN